MRFWAEVKNQKLTELSENMHQQCYCWVLGTKGGPEREPFCPPCSCFVRPGSFRESLESLGIVLESLIMGSGNHFPDIGLDIWEQEQEVKEQMPAW